MELSTNEAYLESVLKQFIYYKSLGEKAIHQIEPEALFLKSNDESNSIAILIQHLAGNMLSRWTNFLLEDGEKSSRNRDLEFETNILDKESLMKYWYEGWECFLNALKSIQPEQLSTIIYIRNEGHTLLEAINRQLSHYPYHVGQIVLIAKQLKVGSFTSLSIPKNSSKEFNESLFKKEKRNRHFTDNDQ